MARPRIFISSTFYDLRQVREDLERTIRELGYEPVRNETGAIPYGKDEKPESAAYREVDLCDIIVSIVGGRFGTESRDIPGYSISQNELRRALERGIQVFIFVEKSVLAEFATYELNKETKGVRYKFADDLRIFQFIEELYRLPRNNPIAPFETASEISAYLKEQFAGLFQRFLQDQKRGAELKVLDEMNSVAKTLKEVVTFLTKERRSSDEAIKSILLSNHPAFRRFAELTKTPYRVFFSDRAELEAWIGARGWKGVDEAHRDPDSIAEWAKEIEGTYIKLRHPLFDENDRLRIISAHEWNDEWVQLADIHQDPPDDDDLPF